MEQLLNGFSASLSFTNFFACFIGCLIGTIIGVLPGLGPTATLTLMLPFTLKYGPETGLIMMAGCWFGAQYGGSTTSILVNIPGESASVVTCIDGYQMAKKGRAGAALAVVAGGSFVAGTIGMIRAAVFCTPAWKCCALHGAAGISRFPGACISDPHRPFRDSPGERVPHAGVGIVVEHDRSLPWTAFPGSRSVQGV